MIGTLIIKKADLDRVCAIVGPQVEMRLLSIARKYHDVQGVALRADELIPIGVGTGLYDVTEEDMNQIREVLDVLGYPKFIPIQER